MGRNLGQRLALHQGPANPQERCSIRCWFIASPSKAVRDERRRHARLHQSDSRENGQTFPMVWAGDNTDVFAVSTSPIATPHSDHQIPENHSALRVPRNRTCGSACSRRRPNCGCCRKGIVQRTIKGRSFFESDDHLTAAIPTGTTVTVGLVDTEISSQVEVRDRKQLVELRQP
jgi:hypothetical protein